METAETAAIGRALAEAGYGIQFVEGEEGSRAGRCGLPVSQAQKMGYQNPQMNTENQMQGYPQAQGMRHSARTRARSHIKTFSDQYRRAILIRKHNPR